jgi:hypothetical protein
MICMETGRGEAAPAACRLGGRRATMIVHACPNQEKANNMANSFRQLDEGPSRTME